MLIGKRSTASTIRAGDARTDRHAGLAGDLLRGRGRRRGGGRRASAYFRAARGRRRAHPPPRDTPRLEEGVTRGEDGVDIL